MLIDDIRLARMTAMKDRDIIAKVILTTLLGELEGIAKHTQNVITNELVIQTCKKFISSNDEIVRFGGSSEQCAAENLVLDVYIPKQLTEDEITAIIIKSGVSNLGDAMKQLKNNYAGRYDGKLASTVIRKIFN